MGQSVHLSPPQIHKPVYDCAEVVKVSGFTAGATVEVYANGSELIGSAKPFVGWWHIRTNRPLTTSDSLTAIQKVGGDESFPTPKPVSVENLPGSRIDPLSVPQVSEPIYHCQQTVETTAVLSGAWVEVAEQPSDEAPVLGRGTTPIDTVHIRTPLLNEGQELYARQVVCRSNKSRFTQKVLVQPLPPKLGTPWVPEGELYVGSKVILVDGLVIGAEVNVFAGDRRIAGGIASGSRTIFPTTEAIKPKPMKYWAEQSLCELKSDPPPTGGTEALTTPPEPKLRTPICPGSDSVIVENTVLGATVKVFVDGEQWGHLTAIGKETLVGLGKSLPRGRTIRVMATQEIVETGPVVSSGTEEVSYSGEQREPRILGGHPFFESATGELQIPGPVFLRGSRTPAGAGPVFRIAACDAELIDLTIEPPNQGFFPVQLVEEPKGHYTGVWDWSSPFGTQSNAVSVGKYIAHFRIASNSGTITKDLPFFVIFNPAEVKASPRLTLDHTYVWLGRSYITGPPPNNPQLSAFGHSLHLSDYRIFGWAMDLINGATEPWKAAKLLVNHSRPPQMPSEVDYDVIPSKDLYKYKDHDNFLLTALLRASGIPAQPVMTFSRPFGTISQWFNTDIWVEARLKGPAPDGERWYALDHKPIVSYNLSQPEGPIVRNFAGKHWDYALRENSDMILTAGGNWVASDLNNNKAVAIYDWNTPCKRPSQGMNAKPWIENLTGGQPEHYWFKAFWECSPDYETSITITVSPGHFMAGNLLSGVVEIQNKLDRSLTGELSLLLVESKLETRIFADCFSNILINDIRLAVGEQLSIPFQIQLPSTICSDDDVLIVARLGDMQTTECVEIVPSFDLEVNMPSTVLVGETFPLQIKVINRLDRSLIGASIELELPFACKVEKPSSTRTRDNTHFDFQSVPTVEPGATANIEWVLRAVSPATSEAIEIKACAPGFGERRTLVATSIPDLRPMDYTDPVVPPTYARENDR